MNNGLGRMQLLTNYVIKAIGLSFPFLLIPIHWLYSPLFFLFPPHFPSLCPCSWAVWPRKRKRAVPVVSAQRRQREETQSGSSESGTLSGDIQTQQGVKIQYRYECMRECVFWEWWSQVFICRTRLWFV